MTEEAVAAAETERPEREIEFLGRKIRVKMPRPESLLVWKRTLSQLQTADVDSWTGDKVMAAMERLRKILDSVLADPADIDFFDDEMLAERLTFQGLAPIVGLTVEAFAADGNRETRRTQKAAPAKKATRKKAAQ